MSYRKRIWLKRRVLSECPKCGRKLKECDSSSFSSMLKHHMTEYRLERRGFRFFPIWWAYCPCDMLRDEILKKDHLLKDLPKWEGGTIRVPFGGGV